MAQAPLANDPYSWTKKWTANEEAPSLFGVLATIDENNRPYTRTISIREINQEGVLFFTQKGSQKVQHMHVHPEVSLTLYLPKHSRQISFQGKAIPLTDDENDHYWQTYPKESQLRFLVYGPNSGHVIASNEGMDQKLADLRNVYQDKEPVRPAAYVGYRIKPETFEFYQLNADRISDSFKVHRDNEAWEVLRVVP